MEARSCNHRCSGRASITHCYWVFAAVVIQHAMRMCHIVICGLPHSTIFFQIISLSTKCIFWFPLQILSEIFFILRRIEWDMIKMSSGFHVQCPLQLSDFNETWIFSTYFRKKTLKYKISWKSVEREPSSMRTDRRTDMTKLPQLVSILSQINLVYDPHHISLRYTLVFCSHVFQVFSFPQVFPPKPCMHLSSAPYMLHAPRISFFLIWSPR